MEEEGGGEGVGAEGAGGGEEEKGGEGKGGGEVGEEVEADEERREE